jgi:hypothetical protein
MKIQVDDELLFELAQWELDIIANDINASDLDADLKRRLEWVLRHKIDQCFDRLEKEWMPKLRADPSVKSIPIDKQAFAEMIFARPDYQDRTTRDRKSVV